ncbi:MAG: PQQ-binding-like beta-propeller repeat protein [Candidatus Bathyarchaeia archaeon]
MNPKNKGRTTHAISRMEVTLLIFILIVAGVIGGVLILNYSKNTASNPPPAPVTTDYSAFQPNPNLGNGTWQFEENNLHVYNYTLNGTLATFNMTVGASIVVPPTLYNGLLLVDLSISNNSNSTQDSGGIAAINMQNGQMVWKTIVPNRVMTQPLTYEGLVIIGLGNTEFQAWSPFSTPVRGTGTNYVAALNFTTGKVVWIFSTKGEDIPTPLIYKGLVVGANGNGVVYALNATSGKEVWIASLPQGSAVSMSSPALSGDAIYFGARSPYIFSSVNLTEEQIAWSTWIPAYGGLDDCSPAIWNNIVISGYTVKTPDGLLEPFLFAMNAANIAEILWQFNETAGAEPSGIQVPPVTVWNGIVYSDPTEGGILYAVNASSGAQLWSFQTGGDTSNANIFNGNLWMVNSNGTLFVLNPETGALLKTANVSAGLGPGNLIFAGQNVIICELNGQVISMPVSNIYSSG